MNHRVKTVIGIAGLVIAAQASAQVTFFERDGLSGRSFRADGMIDNFASTGFNDRASSAVVEGGSWQVCEDAGFSGRCVMLRPGQYPDLGAIGLDKKVSSVRPVESYGSNSVDPRYYAPRNVDYQSPPQPYQAQPQPYSSPPPAYQSPPRGAYDRTLEAPVTSVHAVVGPPEQRCWVERERVTSEGHGGANIPGAIAGAVIGGVLGHQVGSGRGNDVATAAGAVGGAAVGANVGRDREVRHEDVQRCSTEPSSMNPDYWDVTYSFNGVEHHIQTSQPPGPTIAVDPDGNPRG